MYSVARVNRRWLTIFWSDDTPHTAEVERLLRQVEELPGTKRHPKALDIPYTALGLDEVLDLVVAVNAAQPESVPPYAAPLSDVHRESFAHQFVAAKQAMRHNCLLLCDDMGLGKTQSAILAAHNYWEQHGGKWLILAPLFTRASWTADLIACGVIQSADELCVLEGRKASAPCWRDDAEVYFCHYDVIKHWFPRFGFAPPSVVIADEVHNLRNGRTQRAKGAALALGPAKMRILLTGTPIENRPSDLWHLLEMTTGKGTWGSASDFRRRYCGAVQGEWGLEDNSPTNVEELRERMVPFYLRRIVDDIGEELPSLTRTPVLAQLAGKRRALHAAQFKELDLGELFGAVSSGQSFGDETLRVLHSLRQISSEAKLATTVDLVESIVTQGESVVVFCWQRETAEYLGRTQLGIAPTYVVHGGTDIGTRDRYISAFQGNGGALFATYGALKEGVTLHTARHVILHDLDWGPSTIAQAEKRIHRIGQKNACTSHWVICEDSIDTIFASILATKMQNTAEVLGIEHGFDNVVAAIAPGAASLPDRAKEALESWKKW
jgi:SWI/SNF-related matrix-associated actin-dependent regulator 1 of chromatin subfamily A